MKAPLRTIAIAAIALSLATGASGADEDTKVRGITISTHWSGQEWGTDVMPPTLRRVRETGATWIATHPYASIGGDGSVRFRDFDADDPPPYLVRPIREAHALGLRVLIKPHLAYWGSPFSWRGEIAFDDDAAWDRFFDDYERWIVALARACRDADGFVVGTELDRTVHHEDRWRRIIERVRRETGAPLTYAANWPDYESIPFWDALDVIGIQAYWPVADRPLDRVEPILSGWRARMQALREYARAQDRRVVFTELGYNRSFDAVLRPWEYDTDGPEAEPVQEAALRAALRAVEEEPSVVGVFLWKWFPEPHPVGRNFQLATPRLIRAISESWR